MKNLGLILLPVVTFIISVIVVFKNTSFWNPHTAIHIELSLLIIIWAIICNYLFITYFSDPQTSFSKNLSSFIIILSNFFLITGLLLSLDGSAPYLFGNKLNPSPYSTRHLFLVPGIYALLSLFTTLTLKKKGLQSYPYLTIFIYSLFLSVVYAMNLRFFHETFNLAGIASHVYGEEFLLYFIITILLSSVLGHFLNKKTFF